jgi:hypothetical protein
MVSVVLVPPELDELDELELEEELELELEEVLPVELDEELDDDELVLLDELDELLLDVVLEPVPLGTEHSLIPPGTMVPAPKVTSPQMKLPFKVMKVN